MFLTLLQMDRYLKASTVVFAFKDTAVHICFMFLI